MKIMNLWPWFQWDYRNIFIVCHQSFFQFFLTLEDICKGPFRRERSLHSKSSDQFGRNMQTKCKIVLIIYGKKNLMARDNWNQ